MTRRRLALSAAMVSVVGLAWSSLRPYFLVSCLISLGLAALLLRGHRSPSAQAYFDRPHTSNGPTEALNGRLERLRGSALGFPNLTNYIARALLETGGFRPQLHPDL